jgi:hypothetical protein
MKFNLQSWLYIEDHARQAARSYKPQPEGVHPLFAEKRIDQKIDSKGRWSGQNIFGIFLQVFRNLSKIPDG